MIDIVDRLITARDALLQGLSGHINIPLTDAINEIKQLREQVKALQDLKESDFVNANRLRAEVADANRREMMALGFAYAWCCSLLDKARDPRNYEVPQMLADWDAALKEGS